MQMRNRRHDAKPSRCGYGRPELLLIVATGILAAAENTDGGTRPTLDDTRAVLEKWVETRRVISKEQREWALGREVLDDRIGIVRRECALLRAKVVDTEASIAEADRKREELIQENERRKQATAALVETVGALEQRTNALLARLPDPIRERLKPLSQRLPDGTSEVRATLAERYQNVVGILNEVNKFDREFTLTSELRALPDGSSYQVTTLYAGLGQGYYVDAQRQVAGVGRATTEGWTWTPSNEHAAEIAAVIAVLKNEAPARFVQLPVRID